MAKAKAKSTRRSSTTSKTPTNKASHPIRKPTKARRTTASKSSRRSSNKQPEARADEEEDELIESPRQSSVPDHPFPYLRPRTVRVSQAKLRSWPPPSTSVQAAISRLLTNAARHAISVSGAGGGADGVRKKNRKMSKKAMEREGVAAAVERLKVRLEAKVPKMMFPPKTNETSFDLEALMEKNRLLETQLTAAVHTVELLKVAISEEEQALEEDKRALARFEKDAKAEVRQWEQQAKKMHPLLELPDLNDKPRDGAEQIGFVSDDSDDRSIFETDDAELAPVLQQLRSHVDNIWQNNQQVDGLTEGISRASMALNELLRRNGGSHSNGE